MKIIMIKKETKDEDIKQIIKLDAEYYYCGEILTKTQKDLLKEKHKITIDSHLLNHLTEKELLDEVKNITGITCELEWCDKYDRADPYLFLYRKPYYTLDTTHYLGEYVLFDHEDMIRRIPNNKTIVTVRKELKLEGYTPLRIM